jgi:hypothetical protein
MADFTFSSKLELSVPFRTFFAQKYEQYDPIDFSARLRYSGPAVFGGRADPTTPRWRDRSNSGIIDIRWSRFFSGFDRKG